MRRRCCRDCRLYLAVSWLLRHAHLPAVSQLTTQQGALNQYNNTTAGVLYIILSRLDLPIYYSVNYWNTDQPSRRLWVAYSRLSPTFCCVKTDASVLMHEMWHWRAGFYRPAGISISWSSALRTHCSTRTRWRPLPNPSSSSRCAIPSFYTLLQV